MKNTKYWICGCLILLAAQTHVQAAEPQSLYAPLPADVTPELSASGQYAVGVTEVTVTNTDQPQLFSNELTDRSLKLEIWYPAAESTQPAEYINETRSGRVFSVQAGASRDVAVAGGAQKFPVVVLSHGYTGYRTIMYYLGEHLASHGYIVAGIDHTDSTNEDIDHESGPFAGFPSTLFNRSRDQLFTLDAVQNLTQFKAVVAKDDAGLIGYSMGGFGAVNTVGGCYAFDVTSAGRFTGTQDPAAAEVLRGKLNSCAGGKASSAEVDPRWKAMMALAPWGGTPDLFSASDMQQIRLPVLYVAGDHDDISGYERIRWLFEQTGSSDSQLLTYYNARHNIAPHPAPREAMGNELDIGHYFEPAWRSQSLNDINKHFALAWMQCHVRKLADFCEYLEVSGNSDQAGEYGNLAQPWIGFDHRYGLGMKMEHKSKTR
ncbi:acetylhydrolase [Alteromonas aestuariivivens]|uniref:Acetylhydrolase n=1 Tax=Alteromonas aestuariivivens TaxID=1938339 RepID=A0A3D8MF83_9ALTE|nr:acetylhydrolase [Alteromonas aestuariivivens]RDV29412.1 acetylhydrolase [Alteromonas aestuariivivens]